MALVYLDPSALVRLCRDGAGAPFARTLWRRADSVVTARVSDVQVRASLGGGAGSAAWTTLLPGLALVELAGAVADHAAALADGGLAPLDAVQVASALVVRHEDAVAATWHSPVADALRAHGMRVVP